MTPLAQQVREALTDEVLLGALTKADEPWDGPEEMCEAMRLELLEALYPILAQHAHHAQQVRSKWHLEERAGCQVIVANDGSWCCPATDRELELIGQVQALTAERDRAREIAKRWHSHAADGRSGHGNYWPEEQKEIATWPK